jgi:hypothetical protein
LLEVQEGQDLQQDHQDLPIAFYLGSSIEALWIRLEQEAEDQRSRHCSVAAIPEGGHE